MKIIKVIYKEKIMKNQNIVLENIIDFLINKLDLNDKFKNKSKKEKSNFILDSLTNPQADYFDVLKQYVIEVNGAYVQVPFELQAVEIYQVSMNNETVYFQTLGINTIDVDNYHIEKCITQWYGIQQVYPVNVVGFTA